MKTRSRLDEVFKHAFPIPFDDDSKFVFFSDVHRGDDSLSDEFGRNRHIYYHALEHYFQDGFTYIEVGDGDELWEHSSFAHIRGAHVATFHMLRNFYNEDRFYMLFGNHNMHLKSPDFVKKNLFQVFDEYNDISEDLFPDIVIHEGLILTHRQTQQEIFVVHGHQGDLINDQLWKISYFIIRYFWRFMHILGVKYAASPAKNRLKRHKVEKNYNKWNEDRDTMLICGHTHRPKFPGPNDPSYFNCGCCMHPRGINCIEIADGKISLITWNMHSKPDGTLYIKRTVSKGPSPLTNFIGRNEKVRKMMNRSEKNE